MIHLPVESASDVVVQRWENSSTDEMGIFDLAILYIIEKEKW